LKSRCLEKTILDSGLWILDAGYWLLDAGYWLLVAGGWWLDVSPTAGRAGIQNSGFNIDGFIKSNQIAKAI